jgi:hypothetical protein
VAKEGHQSIAMAMSAYGDEMSIMFAITAALYGEITLKGGARRAKQLP